MVRLALVVAMLFGLLVGTIPVSAQQTVTGGPKLGEPANIYDNNGEPIGTVTVTEIVDPYSTFDVINSPPARGYRWVIATVTFSAGANTIPVNTSGFVLIDTGGYSVYQGYYYQSSDDAEKYPPFSASEVPAGQEVTGSIYFQVFNGEKAAIIEYSPTYEQVVVAVDLREAGVAPGDVTVWTTTDDSIVGELSVAGVVDPLEDYDSSYPPQRGFRYVAVAIHFNNTGTRPVSLSSYSFSATDHEGFVVTSAGVYRTPEATAALPDLPYDPVLPGTETTGIVTFLMINGATLKDVNFVPTSDRRVRIAEFARDAEYIAPAITPVATVAVDPACEAVVAWGTQATLTLAPLAPAFELVDKVSSGDTTVEPQALRDSAAAYNDAADALDNLSIPAEAQAASDQVSGVVREMSGLLVTIADDLEAGNAEAVTAGIASLYEKAFSIAGGAYGDLAVRCPGLNDT